MANLIRSEQLNQTGSLATINAGDSGVDGSADGMALKDHQHGVATGTPTGAVEIADSGVEGGSSDLARADHVHPVGTPGAPANVNKGAAAAGASAVPARADHEHDADTATAVELTDSTNAEGASAELARANHTHAHGSRGGTTLHALVTVGANGFMSAADKTKLDSLADASGKDVKQHVRVATEAAGVLASDFENGDTIDSVSLVTGDRILIKNQASAIENGIYVVNASGAPARAGDMPAASDASTSIVPVDQGTKNKDSVWFCVTNVGSAAVGTDGLSFALQSQGAPRMAGDGLVLDANNQLNVGANPDGSIVANADDVQVGILATDAQHGVRGGGTQHADAVASGADGFMTGGDKQKLDDIETGATKEVPHQESITTQNVNTDVALTDTLDAVPKDVAWLLLFLNGVQQVQGAVQDYSISGQTITWLAGTGTAVNMKTSDRLIAYYVS